MSFINKSDKLRKQVFKKQTTKQRRQPFVKISDKGKKICLKFLYNFTMTSATSATSATQVDLKKIEINGFEFYKTVTYDSGRIVINLSEKCAIVKIASGEYLIFTKSTEKKFNHSFHENKGTDNCTVIQYGFFSCFVDKYDLHESIKKFDLVILLDDEFNSNHIRDYFNVMNYEKNKTEIPFSDLRNSFIKKITGTRRLNIGLTGFYKLTQLLPVKYNIMHQWEIYINRVNMSLKTIDWKSDWSLNDDIKKFVKASCKNIDLNTVYPPSKFFTAEDNGNMISQEELNEGEEFLNLISQNTSDKKENSQKIPRFSNAFFDPLKNSKFMYSLDSQKEKIFEKISNKRNCEKITIENDCEFFQSTKKTFLANDCENSQKKIIFNISGKTYLERILSQN